MPSALHIEYQGPIAAVCAARPARFSTLLKNREPNPSQNRYEAHVGDELAGFAEYIETDDLILFTHTEVEDKSEGQGVGSALAKYALDDVRANGDRRVMPQCQFIKRWIQRHPDYVDLVTRGEHN